jgi:hypothetical protein
LWYLGHSAAALVLVGILLPLLLLLPVGVGTSPFLLLVVVARMLLEAAVLLMVAEPVAAAALRVQLARAATPCHQMACST